MWTPLIPFTKALNMLEKDHGEILSRKRRLRERRECHLHPHQHHHGDTCCRRMPIMQCAQCFSTTGLEEISAAEAILNQSSRISYKDSSCNSCSSNSSNRCQGSASSTRRPKINILDHQKPLHDVAPWPAVIHQAGLEWQAQLLEHLGHNNLNIGDSLSSAQGLPRHPIARIGCDKGGNPFDNSVVVLNRWQRRFSRFLSWITCRAVDETHPSALHVFTSQLQGYMNLGAK